MSRPTTPLVAIGWPMATPAYNYVKRLFWLNRQELPIVAIAFAKRLVDQLHGIPILEFEEVSSRDATLVWMTANESLVTDATARFGPRIVSAAELFVERAREGSWNQLASPFEAIPLAELACDRNAPRDRVLARIADERARTLYLDLATAFTAADLTVFFRAGEGTTPDLFYATQLESYFSEGMRRFAVLAADPSLIVDVLLQTAPMHHSGAVELELPGEAHGSRTTLYRSVLGNRLGNGVSSQVDCIVAESVAEWLAHVDQARRARAIIRLRANIVDLHRLVDALDEHGLGHAIDLRQISVDASMLYAILTPR